MLNRRVWEELGPKWPPAYWDDWLREPAQRNNRQILRPVVCRTYHVASKSGTSKNQYGAFLSNIALHDGLPATFDVRDVSRANADAKLLANLQAAPLLDLQQLDAQKPQTARIQYDGVADRGPRSFPALARKLGVMDNEKAGVPRSAYRGVVDFYRGPTKVYLTPNMDKVRAYINGATYDRV